MATTTLELRADINATLARLRIARTVEDAAEIRATERRLNWLLDQIEQPQGTPCQTRP